MLKSCIGNISDKINYSLKPYFLKSLNTLFRLAVFGGGGQGGSLFDDTHYVRCLPCDRKFIQIHFHLCKELLHSVTALV